MNRNINIKSYEKNINSYQFFVSLNLIGQNINHSQMRQSGVFKDKVRDTSQNKTSAKKNNKY